ncbi:lipid-A-disaccharide synthase [Rhizobiales bacterium GAS191]|nr:lipid-A-disaccharide synthase [Rhizobiales bacterium GAS113]SED64201.1 lipid-A-disaccharide synthase [Rhizobiales bacterium GAS191]SEE75615.1 lipid-A-disaccharide synthase [Rhizobiales bacterium GAS188]
MSSASDPAAAAPRPLIVGLVAGEESGDALGAPLMRALREALAPREVAFVGVGGQAMQGEGLKSLFPLSDIAVMGFTAVIARLPLLLRRIRQTVEALLAARPDVLVIIDSPDFTHRVARRLRARLPKLPVVDYVSPSVWAWRPGRARAMRRYVDQVLALLPFEPEAHRKLGGPSCTYVGHPLSQRLGDFMPDLDDEAARQASPPLLLVLPGSRRTEIRRLLPVFGETIARLHATHPIRPVLPAVPWLAQEIADATRSWPLVPQIVTGEAAKLAAFRQGRAALAASGTVSLELALAGVPTVAAYKVGALEVHILRLLVTAPHILLPNLILEERAVPELVQDDCTPEALGAALLPLLQDSPARRAQLAALAQVRERIAIPGETPAARAAGIVIAALALSPSATRGG